MYTFATNGDPPAGDTMYAGSGDDTIIAGAGDDTIAAQLPQDTIICGSGTVDILANAPYLDVSAGANQTVNEGDTVTLTGSFIDPDRCRHAHLRLACRRIQRPADRRWDWLLLHVQPGQRWPLYRYIHRVGHERWVGLGRGGGDFQRRPAGHHRPRRIPRTSTQESTRPSTSALSPSRGSAPGQ